MEGAAFRIIPITRTVAAELCKYHPHAPSLPNSAKYYFALYINSIFRGLAVWGYGINPKQLPVTLFGKEYSNNVADYLELCRFFVDNDNVPPNTASKFLSFTHRVLRKHSKVKYLFTYAAGFQGLVGTIYKAAGYSHITPHETRLIYIPEKKILVHPISLWHRYAIMRATSRQNLTEVRKIFPTALIWCGFNFRYLYFVCDEAEKERLLKTARFEFVPLPKKEDIKIWLEDEKGFLEPITDLDFAKAIPIVKLRSNLRQ